MKWLCNLGCALMIVTLFVLPANAENTETDENEAFMKQMEQQLAEIETDTAEGAKPVASETPAVGQSMPAVNIPQEEKWFNRRYSPVFGQKVNSRMDSHAHFGFLVQRGDDAEINYYTTNKETNQDTLRTNLVTTDTNSFFFAFQLASPGEKLLALEIATEWQRANDPRNNTLSSDGTETHYDDYGMNKISIRFTPKYRVVENDWTWFTLALPIDIRIPYQRALEGQTGRDDRMKPDLLDLSLHLLWFVDASSWFTFEIDAAPKLLVQKAKKKGDDQYIPGVYARAWPALRFQDGAKMTHYIGLHAEYTMLFYDAEAATTDQMRTWLNREVHPTNKLEVGGGYRFRHTIFEAGLSAVAPIIGEDLPSLGVQGEVAVSF